MTDIFTEDSSTTGGTGGTNTMTLEQARAKMRDLGKAQAQGEETRVQATILVLECAFHGNLDLVKNKHGDGIDDAVLLAKDHADGLAKNTVFNIKADKSRAMASKFRVPIKAGGWTGGGPGEPLQTANNFLVKHMKYRKEGRKGMEDANIGLLAMLRVQVKRKTVLDSAELDAFCFKKGKEPATIEDFWIATRKKAQAAQKGKLANCPETDDSAEAQALIALCNKRLANIAKARGGKTP